MQAEWQKLSIQRHVYNLEREELKDQMVLFQPPSTLI